MANIHNLFIVKAEDGSVVNALSNYDLSASVGGEEVPKIVEGRFVVQSDGTFTEYSYPAKNSKYYTKVTNPATGAFAYLKEATGRVSELIVNNCDSCKDTSTGSVEIKSSCDNPVFVKVCDIEQPEYELIITKPIAICVEENGITSTWYARERIVWDSKNQLEVSNVDEYSSDGISWSNTPPPNSSICPESSSDAENFTLELISGQSITFPTNTLFEYSFAVADGTAILSEGYGNISFSQGDANQNGNVLTNKKLLNPVTITAGANSRVIVSGLIELNYNITII